MAGRVAPVQLAWTREAAGGGLTLTRWGEWPGRAASGPASSPIVNAAAGTGIAVRWDHADDADVAAVFATISRELATGRQ